MSQAVFWWVRRASQIQMRSKNLQQYYTLKCLIGDLLSNIIFSQNSDLPMFNIFHMAVVGERRGRGQGEEKERGEYKYVVCDICTPRSRVV